jgi:hypothetical protein
LANGCHTLRWRRASGWEGILQALQQQVDGGGQLDWEQHYLDSTVIRAHQHAAGAKKGNHDQALGCSRGEFSTKIHLGAEGEGKSMALVLASRQRHEQSASKR